MPPARRSRSSQKNAETTPTEQEQEGAGSEQAVPPGKTYSKITLNSIEDDILGRARGFIAKVNMEGPIEDIDDMSSLVTAALQQYIPKLEKKHNNGETFPVPHRLPRGRKPK